METDLRGAMDMDELARLTSGELDKLIEAVARAMSEADGADPDAETRYVDLQGNVLSDWHLRRDEARKFVYASRALGKALE
jgi:hypothetical protein